MEKIIDLHIHTNYSDGFLSPKEVVDNAVDNWVNIISICDHDTIEAYNKELFDYAKSNNILLVPGVEISTKWKKCGIHVLGYNFDLENDTLIKKLNVLRNSRHIYLEKVSSKLIDAGYSVDLEGLSTIDAVTKAHIANNIINNDKNRLKLINDFGVVPQMGEFIEKMMNENCPFYVEKETITPKEAADIIHNAGGIVVLAHPVAYTYEDNLTESDICELVNEMTADGIEADYVYIDKNNIKHNDIVFWNNFASNYNLNTTVGSDFHKEDGIHPRIGLVNEEVNLTKKQINQITKFLGI